MFCMPRGDAERRKADGPGDISPEGKWTEHGSDCGKMEKPPERMRGAVEVAGLRVSSPEGSRVRF
jgi:hypothetical protein